MATPPSSPTPDDLETTTKWVKVDSLSWENGKYMGRVCNVPNIRSVPDGVGLLVDSPYRNSEYYRNGHYYIGEWLLGNRHGVGEGTYQHLISPEDTHRSAEYLTIVWNGRWDHNKPTGFGMYYKWVAYSSPNDPIKEQYGTFEEIEKYWNVSRDIFKIKRSFGLYY
jgi:hypothetical protein